MVERPAPLARSGPVAEDLGVAIGALSTLASTVSDCPNVAEAIRAAIENVERRLNSEEIAIVVCGGREKRRVLNVLAGYDLFDPEAREPSRAIVSVRRGTALRYVARHANERHEKSESLVGDDSPPLVEESHDALARAEVEPEATSMTKPTWVPPFLWALWIWSWNLVLSILGRRVDRTTIELDVADLEDVGDATAERVRKREAAVVGAIRALLDVDRRGHNLVTLAVEVPSQQLPDGVVLVDAPAMAEPGLEVGGWHWRHVRSMANACIVVGGDIPSSLERAFVPIVPYALAEPTDVARIIANVRHEAPLSSLAMAIAGLRERVEALPLVADAEKKTVHARIAALEKNRVPDPTTFRAEQKDRLRGPIEYAARGVLRRALERLRKRCTNLEAEWLAAIDATKTRAGIVACVGKIEAESSTRLRNLVDALMEEIGSELQNASETLLTWVLEEVARQYRGSSARSKDGSDSGVLVLTDLSGGDVPDLGAPPLQAAVRAFDRRQVGIGVGGAAVGAAIGTAVMPVIGSAVGGIVGLFTGFLWRPKKLRADCSERARRHIAGVERAVATRLEESFERFATNIEAAVDESLGGALERRSEAIARLVALEDEAIARESDKLARLDALKPLLDDTASKLREIEGRAASDLRALR